MGPSQVQKPFCVSHFLLVGKRFQPPRPSLSSKGQIQTASNQRSEGIQKQRKSSQETIVQWWGRVLVHCEGIYITIWYTSLSSSMGTNAPTQVEDGNFRLNTSMWTPDWLEPEDWWLRFLEHHPVTSPPTNQRKVTHPADLPQILPI